MHGNECMFSVDLEVRSQTGLSQRGPVEIIGADSAILKHPLQVSANDLLGIQPDAEGWCITPDQLHSRGGAVVESR